MSRGLIKRSKSTRYARGFHTASTRPGASGCPMFVRNPVNGHRRGIQSLHTGSDHDRVENECTQLYAALVSKPLKLADKRKVETPAYEDYDERRWEAPSDDEDENWRSHSNRRGQVVFEARDNKMKAEHMYPADGLTVSRAMESGYSKMSSKKLLDLAASFDNQGTWADMTELEAIKDVLADRNIDFNEDPAPVPEERNQGFGGAGHFYQDDDVYQDYQHELHKIAQSSGAKAWKPRKKPEMPEVKELEPEVKTPVVVKPVVKPPPIPPKPKLRKAPKPRKVQPPKLKARKAKKPTKEEVWIKQAKALKNSFSSLSVAERRIVEKELGFTMDQKSTEGPIASLKMMANLFRWQKKPLKQIGRAHV